MDQEDGGTGLFDPALPPPTPSVLSPPAPQHQVDRAGCRFVDAASEWRRLTAPRNVPRKRWRAPEDTSLPTDRTKPVELHPGAV